MLLLRSRFSGEIPRQRDLRFATTRHLSMIALMEPPMIGVMVPFQSGQKGGFRTGSKLWFFTPFQLAVFGVFWVGLFLGGDRSGRPVAFALQHNSVGPVA